MFKTIWAFLALIISLAETLDVEINEVKCDQSLQVTAQVYMMCNGSKRCTFGDSVEIYGHLFYRSVDTSGIENNLAYASAEISLMTVDMTLFEMMAIPLCSSSLVADSDNQYDCPGDGAYSFAFTYRLPSSGSDTASWMASGWDGDALLQLYAEMNENMLIGECRLALDTYVTPSTEDRLLPTPSAATSAGIALGTMSVLALACMYCYCCIKRPTKRRKTAEGEDVISAFRQMEDNDIPTTIMGPKSVSSATKKTQMTSDRSVRSDMSPIIHLN